MGKGYVYIFDIGFDSLFKIGITKSVKARLYDFRAGNPKIKINKTFRVSDPQKLETILHTHHKNKRLDREIFKLDTADLERIEAFSRTFVSGKPDYSLLRPPLPTQQDLDKLFSEEKIQEGASSIGVLGKEGENLKKAYIDYCRNMRTAFLSSMKVVEESESVFSPKKAKSQ